MQPNHIDALVGQKLRERRESLGMTQTQLGVALGVTQQQVLKYEKAICRVPAGHLYTLTHILDVHCSYFFAGRSEDPMPAQPIDPMLWLKDPECRELNEAFVRIERRAVRDAIVRIVEAIGD